MDGIDSLCPPHTGDLEIHKARASLGEDKLLIGGMDPPTLARITPEETEAYVLKILKEMAPGKNFILSTGDATPHGTPWENIKQVGEVVKEYGSYPLVF